MAYIPRAPRATRAKNILATLLCGILAICLAGCGKTDETKVTELVQETLDAYLVVEEDGEEGEEGSGGGKKADDEEDTLDYGDDATMAQLEEYGADAEEYHLHCLKNFSYELVSVSVDEDGETATATVSITNASLSAAADAAAEDFTAYCATDEAQTTYQEGGGTALFDVLLDYLYGHLDANEGPVTTTVVLTCTKDEDGEWSLDLAGNDEFFSALYGGSDVLGGLAVIDEAEETATTTE